jgi:tetratricopeptide (TPR) repeat protein
LALAAAFAVVLGIAKVRPLGIAEATPGEPGPSIQEWVSSNARGKAFAARGDPARALAEFDQAISHNPGHAVLYANRGGAKLQLGDRQGAVVDCSRAIEMDPGCVEGFLNRAQARKELGDWARAADDYSNALRHLQPSDFLWGAVSVRLEQARRKARHTEY